MWEEQTIPNPAPANCPHLPPLTIHKQDMQKERAGAPPVCTGGRRKVRPHSLPFAPPTPLTCEQGMGMGRAVTPPFAEGAQKKGSPPLPPLSPSPHSHGEQDMPMNAHEVRPICAGGAERYAPLLPLSPTHTKIGRANGSCRDPSPTLYMPSPLHANAARKRGEGCARPRLHTPPPVCCATPCPLFTCPPLTPPCLPCAQGATPFPSAGFLHPNGE